MFSPASPPGVLPLGDPAAPEAEVAETIQVQGAVQGVGFRPTVYQLAQALGLRGEVWNDGAGVVIHAAGKPGAIDQFLQRLQAACPPLARITAIHRATLEVGQITCPDFQIRPSIDGPVHTEILADAATCPQCATEIFDPTSRWYRYPFTNCTHCGPRLSIIQAVPYDRQHTSMAAFALCPQCQREYEDVHNRRFHAQPIACPDCGPQVWLGRSDGQPLAADLDSQMDEADQVFTLLQRGEIVAIKGLGGIHLACDATNELAVQRLRQGKRRYHKPFALMARDLSIIQQYCEVTEAERQLLTSPAAPIVLLQKKASYGGSAACHPIAPSVAPGLLLLGFMLPYTPLHHLILHRMKRPIVLTSGNLSDEPQCIDNEEAREKLGAIAHYLLLHDRPIVNRVDDSVVRVVGSQTQVLRRARGYAPAPIDLPPGFEAAPALLAMGSELKNTFCLIKDGQAILSQHLGDLKNGAAFEAYRHTLNLYLNLYDHQPAAIACDLHPDYLSTKLGQELALTNDLALYPIQHHHAHMAACMVDNGLPLTTEPVLGIALDGLGYGEDDTLWGGEFLLADYCQFQRVGHLRSIALLGGEQAIYQPWRNTYAHLMVASGWEALYQQYGDLELVRFLERQPRALLDQLLVKGINSPLASSCGRLFDAVAAALGICRERCSYEGQGAMILETLAQEFLRQQPLVSEVEAVACDRQLLPPANPLVLDPTPFWQRILQDLHQGVAIAEIAARFHLDFAATLVATVQTVRQHQEFTRVVLTGGVFQNHLLHQQVSHLLGQHGFQVLTHRRIPPNDGGLSLGQGAIAAARSLLTPP